MQAVFASPIDLQISLLWLYVWILYKDLGWILAQQMERSSNKN